MPIEVELPDGSIAEFPDGTDRGVIQTALQRYRKPAAAQPQGMSWSDVPGKALSNLPASAAKFASDIVQPILHPVQTAGAISNLVTETGDKLGHAAGMAGRSVASALGMGGGEAPSAPETPTLDAVGQHFSERYGSMDGLKKTLATDPVGSLGDASLALTGGGGVAARGPGIVARAGQAAQRTAAAIDPLAVAGRTVGGVGRMAAPMLGVTSGTGALPIQTAYQAGRAGNTVFPETMRGQRPLNEVVDMATQGVDAMTADRSRAYTQNMAQTRADQSVLNATPIRQALDQAGREVTFQSPNGLPYVSDATAANTHTQIVDRFNEFLRSVPPQDRTPAAFDAFKKSLREIRDGTQQGSNASRVAENATRAIRNEINAQVPSYATAMREYAQASDLIDEMRRTLSVNDRAMTDTTLRKLTSVMRNNVNTNYGARQQLAEILARYQPDLMPALAGHTMNDWMPRGLARIGPVSVAAHGISSFNPATIAMAPLMSPRLIGEAAYATGQGARMVRNAADLANTMSGNMIGPGLGLAYSLGNASRASGLNDEKR